MTTTILTTSARSKTSATAKEAIALQRADHGTVSGLFDNQKTGSSKRKKALVAEICTALNLHAQFKEKIFHPVVKVPLKEEAPVVTAEHGSIKDLIVLVLSEYVKHHVAQEQNEMFPKPNASSVDLVELGARMVARKAANLARV